MKSIINVRRSSICWRGRRGTDNGRQKNQKSWLWRHCRRRAIYWLIRSPSQTCHAKPKTQINRRRTRQLLSVGGMPTASSLAWKTFLSPKVRTLWHCSRLRSVALYLWLIVVISVRQSTVAAISGLHCRALVMVSSSIRLTAWLQKFKEAGGTVREIDVWAESPRLFLLWLSASSSACHGLLINNDNAITYKAQRDKNARELKLANAAITDMQMRQRDVAALDAKYTELAGC